MRELLATAVCLLLSLGGAYAQSVRCFTFGPAESVTRQGFTKVTPQDAYSDDKGYGFEHTADLLAADRGGWKLERPADEYTASAYGAYRTTSDLTCAFVEGQSDNAFLVNLPDGDYTVWLIASDAAEDPPLYEVWANGVRQLAVRIPRRAFVAMEPFTARATRGQLRLELRGPHGWLLNGLIIGPEGPELQAVVAKAQQDIFFLLDEELPNWQEVPHSPVNPPLTLTPAERARGYVTFTVDPCEPVVPTYVPARTAVGRPLTTFATPGEFEPATFALAADRDLGQVAVELSDFVSDRGGQRLGRGHVTVGVVRCWPQRLTDEVGKGTYAVVPEMIEPATGRATQVSAGTVKQWWLTVAVPTDTPPGRYRMRLRVRPEQAPPSDLEWRLLVLPFTLSRPADKHWGTWLESFPPVGGLRGPERRGRNTPAERDRLVAADLADFRDHGFDLAIFNFYFGARQEPDGSFSYDLSDLIQTMDYWKTLGANTPVVIGCEYTFRNWEYEFAEPDRPHVPGTFSPTARQACVGLVRCIMEEAQRRGWPQLYFYPIDEPGNNKTENRMVFARNALDLVHEVPGAKTATTITAGDLLQLGDRVDARIYAYGHYNREQVLADARRGYPYWWYANGMFYGHSTVASRGLPGFELLRSGAEVASAWGFDCTYANPYNDFDAGHRDWNVMFPGVDGPTPTIYWELCREGVDDCRYVATLQEAIAAARAAGQTAAARRAEAVLAALLDPAGPHLWEPLAFNRYRWRVAREILALRGDRQFALPFAAVTDNPPPQEVVGPNLIPDPSFEAGPQADGFPTGGYSISDQYAEPQQRPVNALVVTDEVAHSGRYALKWDFSQAEGKGAIYGRDRWLIVNVQVPPEVAVSLRGCRVRVGYWFRLGGGAAIPGMTLRQFGRGEYLGGISYTGGLQDPAVWNAFIAEGRLRDDFEGLDIHIACPIPQDPQLAAQSVFYLDDVTLQAIAEPPLAISTTLEEYYLGEELPWTVSLQKPGERLEVTLVRGDRPVTRQVRQAPSEAVRGVFATTGLPAGVYTLKATLDGTQTAQRQVVLTPNPFAWTGPR
ncbi:MAG: hypothetical protein HPY69_21400 [Armatimonadetes bacterium]|nr:hypothetical protein [Armatimonadota bacterium]